MSDDGPVNPISEMAAGMIGMHELMLASMEAGFSPEQAFRIVLKILACSMGQSTSD